MALKKYKPITAGTRWRVGNAYAEITTDTPEKTLLEKVKSTAGRNSQGRRAMRYRGGGHKKMYRIIDFKRDRKEVVGTVVSIEYDPNRTSFIALIQYGDGEKRYILAPQGLQVGGKVQAGDAVARMRATQPTAFHVARCSRDRRQRPRLAGIPGRARWRNAIQAVRWR